MTMTDPFQAPLPQAMTEYPRGLYNPFPTFPIRQGVIQRGYGSLAHRIREEMPLGLRVLVIDGFIGVDWEEFRQGLEAALAGLTIKAQYVDFRESHAEVDTIRTHVQPFLGGDDPLFGKVYPLGPDAFFNPQKVAHVRTKVALARGNAGGSLTIVIGCGASLIELWDRLWYVDVPKDTIQERARRGRVTNLGESAPVSFNEFYKRSYFVDWPALNRQKNRILGKVDLFVDGQQPDVPSWLAGNDFRLTLHEIAESPFRVRPWFFPGPWGGQFMKGHMGLDPAQPNYAWSFEIIVPENGITLEDNGNRLECSFDCLMFAENLRVLGEEAGGQFGYEWPIRLDYLDTIDGGNLSTQCHPRPQYIRKEFGETFTQDESYYIVNAKPDARVYIGLTESCDRTAFKQALQQSQREGVEVPIDQFVHSEPSKPHDLFLIPNGTVHCSGAGNLVLEISATPYIYTFKIYDYLRKDLDGNLRTINIDRAFENIRFERRASWVRDNLLAKPRAIREGEGWKEYVLMDRPEFFYNIHRLDFERECILATEQRGIAVNLVEGERVTLTSPNGRSTDLAYLESMIIPAATREVRIINRGARPCKLVLVFVRPGVGVNRPLNAPYD